MSVENVVVIGSGPAGYTAAIYLARAGLAPVVLTSVVEAGGALMNTTEVENFPGYVEGIMGPDLMENLRQQAERFGARLVADDATALELRTPIKTIRTGSGDEYRSHAVVLAMGSAFRKLGVDGEDRLSGYGVSWCATCDGFFFTGKDIAVVGGGDSALEGITTSDTITGEEATIGIDGLVVAIGHDPRSNLVAGQLDLDADRYVRVAHPTTATNLDGVFACGDLVDQRYRQAVTAAGTGCAAALDAEHYLTGRGLAHHAELAAPA